MSRYIIVYKRSYDNVSYDLIRQRINRLRTLSYDLISYDHILDHCRETPGFRPLDPDRTLLRGDPLGVDPDRTSCRDIDIGLDPDRTLLTPHARAVDPDKTLLSRNKKRDRRIHRSRSLAVFRVSLRSVS